MIMIHTYLNSYLPEAPREYVLHGLNPGLNYAKPPPGLPLRTYLLLPRLTQYLAVNPNGSGFTPNPLGSAQQIYGSILLQTA